MSFHPRDVNRPGIEETPSVKISDTDAYVPPTSRLSGVRTPPRGWRRHQRYLARASTAHRFSSSIQGQTKRHSLGVGRSVFGQVQKSEVLGPQCSTSSA